MILFFSFVALIGIIFATYYYGKKPITQTPTTITIVGTDDDPLIWQSLIRDFQKLYPYITVTYTRENDAGYDQLLLNQLAEGRAPDIFILHNTFLTKYTYKVSGVPGYTAQSFQNTFVDGLADDLILSNGFILGLPLYLDTPALFYNKDFFNSQGIVDPPKNWQEFTDFVQRFTQTSAENTIQKSVVGLGDFVSVENAFEIISSLMFQQGEPIISRHNQILSLGKGVENSITFYTSFDDERSQNYTWNPRMGNSLQAFAEEKTPLFIGFAADIPRIRAANTNLNFGISPFPQIKNSPKSSLYGRYAIPAVSAQSRNKAAAWQFINFLTSAQGAAKYSKLTNLPPARRDLINSPPSQELGVFSRQSLIAQSWATPDDAYTKSLFQNAIESVLSHSLTPAAAGSALGSKLRLYVP